MGYTLTPARPSRPTSRPSTGSALESYKQTVDDRARQQAQMPAPTQPSRYGAASLSTAPPPAAPMPAAPAPMAAPGMSPAAQLGGMMQAGAQPPQAGANGLINRLIQKPTGPGDDLNQRIASLPMEYQVRYNDYVNSLYAGPDFPGRHEMAQQLRYQFALELLREAGRPDVDYSLTANVGDQFDLAQQRAIQDLAGSGLSDPGIMAGVVSNLAGREAATAGQMRRELDRERYLEDLNAWQRMQDRTFGLQTAGLQRNWAEQDKPGFWDKALGVVGSIGGALLPGIGDAVGGIFGGADAGGDIQPAAETDPYALGSAMLGVAPQTYGPVDPSDPWYGYR